MADNKSIQKVFGLSDYRKLQLASKIPERTRETYREYGYFGGGFSPSTSSVSSVERIDFSNDTVNASVRGPLAAIRYSHGATSNNDFGYFGVAGPGAISSFYRINYSNDTQQASVRGSFSRWRRYITAAAGNLNFGYYAGGFIPVPTPIDVSTVDRIDYSNDLATTSVRNPLSQSKQQIAATGNSNFGYFGGGVNSNIPASYSTVERINYSNDLSLYFIRGPLSLERAILSATGNSNFGYFGGGSSTTIVDRINYANDLAAAPARTFLPQIKNNLSATGNSNFGYFGASTSPSGLVSSIDRLDYANDTVTTTVRGAFNTPKAYSAATSSHNFGGTQKSSFASNFTFPTVPNAGYFGGGTDGTNNLATIDKVDYANDTATASVRSALSIARNSLAATGNGVFGYFVGGQVTSSGTTTVDRLEYSSDTQNTTQRTNLQLTLAQSTAVGNENFGYFAGGISQIQKIDYSNDSTSIVGNIDDSRQLNAATSTRNYGYFSGGDIPEVSIIQRMNFSNDTANALFRTNHGFARRQHGGVGNETYGYFGGGVIAGGFSTLVERLDYSNDTSNLSFRGPLSLARRSYLGVTGSSNFGYFSGGDVPGPTLYSTVDRINYSNDTAVASTRGPLSTAKSSGAASSPLGYGGAPIYFTNPLPEVLQKQIEFNDSNTLDLPFKRVLGSYGYFGGGSTPSLYSNISRLDFSNDTSNSSARGPLSSTRYSHQATGNSNFGYFGGGRIILSPSPIVTSVDRIDYSSDTSTGISRGALSAASYFTNAITSGSFGYFDSFGNISKLNYSNDSQTSVTKFTRVRGQNRYGLSGNSNFAYYAGGGSTGGGVALSRVDRLNFSNDGGNSVYRGNLTFNKSECDSVGNNNFGYVGGGRSPSPTTVTVVDRIDYSNDTITASFRFNLDRFRTASTGNLSFGYFAMGGVTAGNTINSNIYRLDYSNDTSVSVRSNTTYSTWYSRGVTNARNS